MMVGANLDLERCSDRLGARLDQFEADWLGGDVPDVARYLSQSDDTGSCCDLIEMDLEFRWRRFRAASERTARDEFGFPLFPQLDDYLPLIPDALDQVFSPRLLAQEYRVRTRWGDRPDRQCFVDRFPNDPSAMELALDRVEAESGCDVDDANLAALEPSDSLASASTVARIDGRSFEAEAIGPTIDSPFAFGKYRLETLAGRGGFGEVWKAYDPRLKRSVAIKFPRTDKRLLREEVSSFQKEAEKLAALDHVPGVVTVFECGEHDGRPYIVSEFIEGESLETRVQRCAFSFRQSAQIVAAVATTLNRAHLKGLVHRDIKPSNILLDSDEAPLLTDFGLCVTEEEQLDEGRTTVGTFAYMSPEQARGESYRTDGRADIYALGVILYRLLTGRLPFVCNCPADYIDQILHREPRPPRSIDSQIPAELERICLKCLNKPVAERYTTAADLASDLQEWLSQDSVATSHSVAMPRPAAAWEGDDGSQRRSRRAVFTALAGIVLLLAVMAGFAAMMRMDDPSQVAPAGQVDTIQPLQQPRLIAWNPYDTHDSYGYEQDKDRFRFDAFGDALFLTGYHHDETIELKLRYGAKHWKGWAGVFWGEGQSGDGRQHCQTIIAGHDDGDPNYRIEIYETVIGPLSGRRSVISDKFVASFAASLPGDDQAVLRVEATVRQVKQIWLNSVPLLDEPVELSWDDETNAADFGLGFCGRSGEFSVFEFHTTSADR